jgi:hypothetical protein
VAHRMDHTEVTHQKGAVAIEEAGKEHLSA